MLKNIITKIDYINIIDNKELEINGISQLLDNADNTITWCNDKNLTMLNIINNKTIIVSENLPEDANKNNNYVIVNKPRVEFKKLLDICDVYLIYLLLWFHLMYNLLILNIQIFVLILMNEK